LSANSKKIIKTETLLKFILKERDIKIDELFFNNMFDNQFSHFFQFNAEIFNVLGMNNVIFFRNIYMTEMDIFKIIQELFGKWNVEHIFHTKKHIKHTTNLNNIIYKGYTNNKPSEELKFTVIQIINFMFNRLLNENLNI